MPTPGIRVSAALRAVDTNSATNCQSASADVRQYDGLIFARRPRIVKDIGWQVVLYESRYENAICVDYGVIVIINEGASNVTTDSATRRLVLVAGAHRLAAGLGIHVVTHARSRQEYGIDLSKANATIVFGAEFVDQTGGLFPKRFIPIYNVATRPTKEFTSVPHCSNSPMAAMSTASARGETRDARDSAPVS